MFSFSCSTILSSSSDDSADESSSRALNFNKRYTKPPKASPEKQAIKKSPGRTEYYDKKV